MASHDDLETLVGKLKRSAIDAWLHDEDGRSTRQAALFAILWSVDSLVERWTDLPDPSIIGDIVESSRQITRRLAGAAASVDGTA
ncbi:MAG: hypothetical protein JWM50_2062 [Microbacteriaceae bacterium]|jgi:hypothetical protein|nr:hypothetical protein [Microbacteriaceae bacterium]